MDINNLSEGIMLKRLGHRYETPNNHGMTKLKEYAELDTLIVEKDPVKNTPGVWNYTLAIGPISEEQYKAIKKEDEDYVVKFEGKYYNKLGNSDNTDIDLNIGGILRIVAEDINIYTTKDGQYDYFGGYIMLPWVPVSSRNSPDGLDVAGKLSKLTGERIDFLRSNGKEIPEDEFKDMEPLPKKYYEDYRETKQAFAQFHIRGIEPESMEKWKRGNISISELVKSHSLHCDIRMDFGFKKLIQWVLTQDSMQAYIDSLCGNTDPKTGNVSKGLLVSKPSSEPPQYQKNDSNNQSEDLLLDKKGADIVEDIVMKDKYLILAPGQVGATPYKSAILFTIWQGKVKAGTQRKSMHEYFFYPEESNKDCILDGRYIAHCFSVGGGQKRWWFWKCKDDPKPMNPYEHNDEGYYWPIPAEEVELS